MSQFFDDLARTMARPMPRRGALRLLGAALGSAWVGGMAPRARGAPSRRTHTCDTQVATGKWKYCTEATEYCFPTCCPNERRCSVGPRDPNRGCPIVTTCCDPCEPRASTPDGKGGCKAGPVADNCGPKTCGPDITDALERALGRVKTEFGSWSAGKRATACAGLVTLPAAAFSWDIRELGPGGRADFSRRHQGCDTCGFSVQVGPDCHYSGSVNYAAYGAMMRLCHDHFANDDSVFKSWFTSEEMLDLIYIHKSQTGTLAANFQASNEWALAAYNGYSVRLPPGDRPDCKKRCTTPYSGRGFTVNWLPNVIGP